MVVSSTWSAGSLWGSWPELIERLGVELPADSYQLVAVLHPNIVQGHGAFQVRAWLASAFRAGLILIPPDHGWQAALVAADLVIGDHGSVTAYAAALDRAVLLGAFPENDVAPGTAVHRLGQRASRLQRQQPLRPQIESALRDHRQDRYSEVAGLVSSVPGDAAERIRTLLFGLLHRPEPSSEALNAPYSGVGLAPAATPRLSAALVACVTDASARRVTLERFAAEPPRSSASVTLVGQVHLAVHHTYPGRRLRQAAEVLIAQADTVAEVESWLTEALDTGAHTMTAAVGGPITAIRHRRFGRFDAEADGAMDGEIVASAVLAWLDSEAVDGPFIVEAGHRIVRVLIRRR